MNKQFTIKKRDYIKEYYLYRYKIVNGYVYGKNGRQRVENQCRCTGR